MTVYCAVAGINSVFLLRSKYHSHRITFPIIFIDFFIFKLIEVISNPFSITANKSYLYHRTMTPYAARVSALYCDSVGL